MSIGRWAKVSIVLIVLALLSVVVGHLALTDIYHGSGDVSLEWDVLRVCFGIIVISQIAALVTLLKVVRQKVGLEDA
jgi:putative copper export protein